MIRGVTVMVKKKKKVKKKTTKKKTVKKNVVRGSETPEQRAEFLRFLKLAIDTEKQGLIFYSKVRSQVEDYNMKRLMDVILPQEKEHLRIVTEVYNAEKRKGIDEAAKKADAYKKQKPLRTPIRAMKHLDEVVKKKVTIYNLFKKAVEFEEGISRLYMDMMLKTNNPKIKRFFKKLADEELHHKDFIMMHQEAIYDTGHWFGWEHVRLET